MQRSRLAFGVEATTAHMNMVEIVEDAMRSKLGLLTSENLRVRLLPRGRAAVEVDADRLSEAERIVAGLAEALATVGESGVGEESELGQSGSQSGSGGGGSRSGLIGGSRPDAFDAASIVQSLRSNGVGGLTARAFKTGSVSGFSQLEGAGLEK